MLTPRFSSWSKLKCHKSRPTVASSKGKSVGVSKKWNSSQANTLLLKEMSLNTFTWYERELAPSMPILIHSTILPICSTRSDKRLCPRRVPRPTLQNRSPLRHQLEKMRVEWARGRIVNLCSNSILGPAQCLNRKIRVVSNLKGAAIFSSLSFSDCIPRPTRLLRLVPVNGSVTNLSWLPRNRIAISISSQALTTRQSWRELLSRHSKYHASTSERKCPKSSWRTSSNSLKQNRSIWILDSRR